MKQIKRYFFPMLFALCSCMGTKFSYITDGKLGDLKGYDSVVQIDNSYQLYMRQVLRVPNEEGLRVPRSSPEIAIGSVIEKQYLLVSKAQRSAIVISNIPNKYISFYDLPQDSLKLVTTEKEDIDIWFFNQFRFGILENDNNIFFPGIVSGKPQLWHFQEVNGGHLNLESLSECDNDGSTVYKIEPAYAIPLLFYKIPNFQIVFKDNSNIQKTDDPQKIKPFNPELYYLEDNSIHLICTKKGWYTYFKLRDFDNDMSNILFSHKRMYAAPFSGVLPCKQTNPLTGN